MALPWDSPKLVKRNISPKEFELIENKNIKMCLVFAQIVRCFHYLVYRTPFTLTN